MIITLPEAEQLAIEQVRFINETLESMRSRNRELEEKLGPSYAKLIGVGTIFEDCICTMRKAKSETDKFLSVIREDMRHR
jgi:hypothetical protein